MAAPVKLDRDILPDAIKPIHYGLSLYDLELGGSWTYKGQVSMKAQIKRATKEIVLNAHLLKITGARFATPEQVWHQASEISYDTARQRVTITFPETINPVDLTDFVIEFQGVINNDMAGFSRAKYKPAVTPSAAPQDDAGNHFMFSTQFESCDARRAFPCFDEPNLKATFDFTIEIPADLVALSNMPVKATMDHKKGYKQVSFDRTPVMSTYLLAWAFGDFEYIESFTKRKYNGKEIPCRLYTTRGLKEQGEFALQHVGPLIDFYSEKFEIDYPLPKADLLAVPEFSAGAMENWGLVTYRTAAVLFDKETSDEKSKNYTAYVVAHELAHMWFGNLVTMDWWSELWLNEGFATWVGFLATHEMHPDWNIWSQVCAEPMQAAFELDSLRSSHPIQVTVKDALDVDQIFDAISYRKGMSVIRMLAAHLGQDTFLRGVASYLKAHAYGNATTKDLWTAISEASGQDVNALMEPWICKIGFPVVTVLEEPGQIIVKQSRCLLTGDVTEEEDETTWWIPLNLEGRKSKPGVESRALTTKADVIRDVDDEFYKINSGTSGFYRVNYLPARLARLGTQVARLSLEDKIGVIFDAGALSLSGHARTATLLSFLEGLHSETNFHVWSAIFDTVGSPKSIFQEDAPIHDAMKTFILKLVTPAAEKIGWEYPEGEDFLTVRLRALLINSAGGNGHKGIIAEAQRLFQAGIHDGDPKAIHPNLRGAIYTIAVREGGKAEYEAIKQIFRTTTSTDGQTITLQAMARTRDPSLITDFLTFLFTEVKTQDIHGGASALATTPKGRHALWNFIKANFDTTIHARMGANRVVLDRFLRLSLNKFSDLESEMDVARFFARRDNRGYDRSLKVVGDRIRMRAGCRAREGVVLLEWLRERGYASKVVGGKASI